MWSGNRLPSIPIQNKGRTMEELSTPTNEVFLLKISRLEQMADQLYISPARPRASMGKPKVLIEKNFELSILAFPACSSSVSENGRHSLNGLRGGTSLSLGSIV